MQAKLFYERAKSIYGDGVAVGLAHDSFFFSFFFCSPLSMSNFSASRERERWRCELFVDHRKEMFGFQIKSEGFILK